MVAFQAIFTFLLLATGYSRCNRVLFTVKSRHSLENDFHSSSDSAENVISRALAADVYIRLPRESHSHVIQDLITSYTNDRPTSQARLLMATAACDQHYNIYCRIYIYVYIYTQAVCMCASLRNTSREAQNANHRQTACKCTLQ